MTQQTGVLFVCMGNICRSPLAEGVFLHLAQAEGVADRFDVDSCGTGGWHAGARPDRRSLAVAQRHGVTLPGLARKLDPDRDFPRFPWLMAMDRDNADSLIRAGAPAGNVHLLRSFDAASPGEPLEVPDPYYGGPEGFDHVYEMVLGACAGLLQRLLASP